VTITERDEAHGLIASAPSAAPTSGHLLRLDAGPRDALHDERSSDCQCIPVHERAEAIALIHDAAVVTAPSCEICYRELELTSPNTAIRGGAGGSTA